MRLYRLGLRYVIIFLFAFSLVSGFVLASGSDVIRARTKNPILRADCDARSFQLLESIAAYAHELGGKITENFNNLVTYIQAVFHSQQNMISGVGQKSNYDVTIVGFVNFADGIGRQPILFKECFNNRVTVNFLSTRDIPVEIEDVQLGLPRLNFANKKDIGAVSILVDILADKALPLYTKMPESLVKIAYTMIESTEIPNNWASILNSKFDMAIVPDQYFVEVYQKCGVTIPIFVLPLPLMLEKFLALKPPVKAHKPFVFGMTGGFWKRKNHLKVLEAFAREFGNSSEVKLRLHGRFGEPEVIEQIKERIAAYGLTNVEFIEKQFNWSEYLDFFSSLDCYVFLSMGEGFSITPREALAAGIPCILTKNTAQITICESGAVRPVKSDILVPAFYDCHYTNNMLTLDQIKRFLQISNSEDSEDIEKREDVFTLRSSNIGYQFDCTVRDARKAMRDMYKYYDEYLEMAQQGREWVKCYLCENLSDKYVSVVKPESIVLGRENIIGDKFLMMNSKALYEKYRCILNSKF
ncbi:MAG: glycosyltransferase [bacterium]